MRLGHVRCSRDELEHRQAVGEVEGVCQAGLDCALQAEAAVLLECLRLERLGARLCIPSKPSLPRLRPQLAIESYRDVRPDRVWGNHTSWACLSSATSHKGHFFELEPLGCRGPPRRYDSLCQYAFGEQIELPHFIEVVIASDDRTTNVA